MILTLYRNYDTTQPVKFEGRSKDGVLCKLRQWLDQSNGAFDQGAQRHKPLWADGIAIVPAGGRNAVVLLRNGHGWEIWKGTTRSKPLVVASWVVARAVFLHYAYRRIKNGKR